jgi:hypoxanthine phosphoribosyltransferase
MGGILEVTEFSSPELEPLISSEQIERRVSELGRQIAMDYAGKNPLLVGVLKGACIFMSDLIRSIDTKLAVEFMAISSYGAAQRSSGEVRILKDLDAPLKAERYL